MEFTQERRIGANLARRERVGDREGGQRACGLADLPFHRMQTVASVCDVGRTGVPAGRKEIFHALRDNRTQRNLKGQRAEIDVRFERNLIDLLETDM